jgi:hypothetical protein
MQPIPDISSWNIEDVEVRMAELPHGLELERIRELAQSHVYQPTESREARLRWAKLSLAANRRFHGGDPRAQTRMHCQEFRLRAWVIEHLGQDADPDWNPEALAEDTLAALSLRPDQAEAITVNWRELPIEQIGLLRRHKNLTGHLDGLVPGLQPGPIKDQLAAWASVRSHLP